MEHDELARISRAIGDPTRAHILTFLIGCCCPVAVGENGDVSPVQGATAGQVCCHITGDERINSKVSFHLKELRLAGLIHVERRGKFMVCSPHRETLARLAAFFDAAAAKSPEGC